MRTYSYLIFRPNLRPEAMSKVTVRATIIFKGPDNPFDAQLLPPSRVRE